MRPLASFQSGALARCAYLDRIDLAAILSMKFCKFE
jgi:hypothetical protein